MNKMAPRVFLVVGMMICVAYTEEGEQAPDIPTTATAAQKFKNHDANNDGAVASWHTVFVV